MITLIRKIFWFALFLVFTLGFVTLWDNGIPNTGAQFTTNAKSEVADLMTMIRPIKRPADKSDEPAQ
jgi:hypothetical protein